jgi:hypothetical protein
MAVVAQQRPWVGIAPACAALSVARATFYPFWPKASIRPRRLKDPVICMRRK